MDGYLSPRTTQALEEMLKVGAAMGVFPGRARTVESMKDGWHGAADEVSARGFIAI